ncbi:hypothetical protein MELE44368_25090 [Mycolicibacterium elephantis DSM 44368]|uniref:Uncharacterized protein n=1 Tax=Mycolicibacterium elephantis DSM 44368 TaxID=1335622 RepID=A0A439DQ52_9MYCO|nr:hypothetical protein MELE44368_25090 [Mycolicibacterium elephantis DSM 44368]
MGERCLGVVGQTFAGGHQMASHQIRGGAVQSCELPADFGRKLLGLDVLGDRRAGLALWFSIMFRLCATSPVGAR